MGAEELGRGRQEGLGPGSLWRRLPIIVQAVATGLAMAAAGTVPWALLVKANLRWGSAVPWAIAPAAAILWVYWRLARGAGWPRWMAEARRERCRARALSGDLWAGALLAGGLGLVALVLLLGVANRMVRLPAQSGSDVTHVPLLTLAAWVVVGAAVSGIVEESAFRGYMQGPIERRHGPVVAILVTGAAFGLAHFTHPEVTLVLMPYYLAVAAIYGALAYLTGSILPGVVLHTGGNILGSLDLFTRGPSEWQTPAAAAPLIWETGADASFWASGVAALAATAAALWAYTSLARISKSGRWRDGTRPE